MTPEEKHAHAARVIEHGAQAYAADRRCTMRWIPARLQWVAHYVGEPELEGYGRTTIEAIDMLAERAKL